MAVHGVTDLDHDIDFGGDIEFITLRQVLLSMKTKQYSSWLLFVFVDFDFYRNEIIAVIHKKHCLRSFQCPLFPTFISGDKIWSSDLAMVFNRM